MDNNQMCNCKRCNGIVHEIKRGDTLYTLSRLYNVSVGNIMRENKGINPYNLMIGDKICIPMRVDNFPFIPNRREGMMNNSMMDEETRATNIDEYSNGMSKDYDNHDYDVEYYTSEYDNASLKELIDNNISVKDFANIIKKYI